MKVRLLLSAAILLATAGAARAQGAATPAPTPTPTETPAAAPTPPAAAADDVAAGFGVQGQIAISGELQASFVHESTSSVNGVAGTSSNVITVQPSLDYFVMPNVSVGGALSITHGSIGGSSGDVTGIGILARAGYNLHLTPLISLWPQLQLGYLHESFSGGGGPSASGYSIPLQIFVPFLFHVTTHLFVGIGPAFSTELVSKVQSMDQPKTTDIGVESVVGGYFGP
jgi:hypothetical protein